MVNRRTPQVAFLISMVICLLLAWAWLVYATAPTTCIGAAVLGLDGAHTTYPVECR